jgi:hypothetical protein
MFVPVSSRRTTGFAQLAELLTDAGRSAGEPIPVAIEIWR